MPFRGWESSQLHTRVTHANLTPLEILSCLRQISVLLRIFKGGLYSPSSHHLRVRNRQSSQHILRGVLSPVSTRM
jgi:hypothetical protein